MTSAPDGNDTTLQPYCKLYGKAGYKRIDNQCGLFGAARTQLIQLFRKLRRGDRNLLPSALPNRAPLGIVYHAYRKNYYP